MAPTDPEIKAVAHVLKLDHEGKTAEQVAEECVKALRSLEATATRQMMGPMVVGEVFRTPVYRNPLIVAWQDEDGWSWLVNKTDTYGILTNSNIQTWIYREPARITDGVRLKALTNTDGHVPGDIFLHHGLVLTVIAVCAGGVLARWDDGVKSAESNENLKRFYSKVEV